MHDVTAHRRFARHTGPAESRADVARERARALLLGLAALALLVAATVLTYRQMHAQETGAAVAGGRPVAVAEQSAPPAIASSARAASPGIASSPPAAPVGSLRWWRVLERLNDKRHTAWLRGDPRLLGEVYLPRSRALALDREVMRDYLSRGLRVHGVRLHFGRVILVARSPGLVFLRVVDRLDAMTAIASDGRDLPLPLDQPTRHRIVLRPLHGSWRIAAVSAR